MQRPKMILFDYGQTLVKEVFDGVRGTEAVLRYAVKNKYHMTAARVQAEAEAVNRELGRADPYRRHLFQIEVPNHMFTAYLYESLGIELSLSAEQIDKVFWNAAAPSTATDGIEAFLAFLYQNGFRTGVISNISYAGKVVENRINELIPDNHFEFIIASSEYMYRKPNRRIFELALERAGLPASEVWYVGDQYECDIVGARNAGLFPVWYTGAADMRLPEDNAVCKVSDWGELQALLEKI